MRRMLYTLAVGAIVGTVAVSISAQAPGGGRGRGPGAAAPTKSVRGSDSRRFRTSTEPILGWKIGIAASAFPELTFSDAAAKADAAGMAFIEGFSGQKVSAEIAKNLDYNLAPEELAAVRSRLLELHLKMPAYEADPLPADEASQRKMFQFAKSLGVEAIVCKPDIAVLPALERLADQAGINLAIENPTVSTVQGRGRRVGVEGDMASLTNFRDRMIVAKVHNNDPGLGAFLRQMNQADLKPAFIRADATDVDNLEKAVQLAMGDRVDQICRNAPITQPDHLPQEIRAGIEAASPHQPIVKPKKPRKLLILDENVNAYVHATIPHGNLALRLMGENTGAFEPVFSNDLSNLKYPKIKEFDAIFLNSAGGMIFVDPEVREGIMRYMREGGGLAGLHAASYASLEWPEFTDLIGAGDGPHRVEKVTLKIDDPNSPVTAPLGGIKNLVYVDEFYHFPTTGPYSRDKLHILFSIDTQKTDMTPWPIRPDKDYGLSWIKNYEKGRVFYCELGHTPTLFMTPMLTEHILAGIQFVLGDLEADATPSAKLTAKRQN
jgi:type 1 glutamine amidotransferase